MTEPRFSSAAPVPAAAPGAPAPPAPVPVPVPPDADARAAIFRDLDATLFVAAGAGTGKTTALVDRLVGLLTSGRATVDHIAAITFTEAAAAELRARARQALQAAAEGQPWRPGAPVPEAAPAIAASRAAAAVADFDRATITTLHGFARTLLAANPLAAGLPPVFTVVDESAAGAMERAEWADAAAALLADPAWAPVVQRAAVLDVRLAHLAELLRLLSAEADRLPAPSSTAGGAVAAPGPWACTPVDLGSVVAPLASAVAALGACTDAQDLLAQHLRAVTPVLGRLQAAAGDDLRALAELRAAPPLKCGRGKKPNWPDVDAVRADCAAAEDARGALLAEVAGRCLQELGRWLAHRVAVAGDERRRRGELTFHDLLVLALRLLRDDPAARRDVSRRYRCLLIDELQDTDPVQAELAVRIAAAGDPPPGAAWTDLAVEVGRLFLVGDAKQAIYRFRRADIAVVETLQAVVGGRPLSLSGNWRSVPGVLHWVNAVVGPLMGEGVPGVQAPYEPLAPQRPGDGDVPPVTVLGGPDGQRRRAAERRQVAMGEVAATVSDAVGRSLLPDGRPLQADDVCVLLPTRAALPQLEDALTAAGLDYRLDSGSLIYASAQVRDVLAVLRAIDDPGAAVATLAALRTPLLACGDDELAEYAAALGEAAGAAVAGAANGGATGVVAGSSPWDFRRPPPPGLPAGHRVAAAMAELAELHGRRWWSDPGRLVAEVVERLQATVLTLDERRWRDGWRRLRFLQAEARTFCDQVGGDLRQFLAWAELRADEHARTTDLDVPAGDGGAVHVMTVHGAKGLEFPMVVVCGLDTPPGRRPAVDVLFGPTGPELRAAGWRTAGYDTLSAHEVACEDAERVRLLYVATTRARDHLVVSIHHDPAVDCLARRVHDRCQAVPGLWAAGHVAPAGAPAAGSDEDEGSGIAPRLPLAGAVPAIPPARAEAERQRRFEQEHAARVAAAESPPVLAATSVASRMAPAHAGPPAAWGRPGDGAGGDGTHAGDGRDELGADLDTADGAVARPWRRRGRAATAVGRAVHAVLHTVDLASGDALDDATRAAAAAEGVPEEFATVRRLARAALASQVVREAVAGERYWREVYVGAPIGGRLVEGFVDLLVEHPHGLQVVDYKTDTVPDDAAVDAAVARYRPQAATYALLLARTTGRPVTACTFVFLRAARPGGEPGAVVRTVDGSALAAATAEVEAWLAGEAAASGPG